MVSLAKFYFLYFLPPYIIGVNRVAMTFALCFNERIFGFIFFALPIKRPVDLYLFIHALAVHMYLKLVQSVVSF